MKHADQNLEPIRAAVTEAIGSTSDSIAADLRLFEVGQAKRAILLYKVADGGKAGAPALLATAVALELLQLGLRKHFDPATPPVYGTPAANLALITADRYYAKALTLVVALDDDRLVRILCGALAEASEGYSFSDITGAARRRDALVAAAHRLGCLMGGHREYKEASLKILVEEVDSALSPNPS